MENIAQPTDELPSAIASGPQVGNVVARRPRNSGGARVLEELPRANHGDVAPHAHVRIGNLVAVHRDALEVVEPVSASGSRTAGQTQPKLGGKDALQSCAVTVHHS